MKIQSIAWTACFAALAFACAEQERGALTASIIWPTASRPGLLKQGLRTAAVPPEVARLQILAVDMVSGSTLAETNLYQLPAAGELQLNPAGGTWTLDDVPVGTNRMIRAQAYLGANTDPRINNLLIFDGEIANIEVKPGQLVDAGLLRLRMIDGVRYPPLDYDPPDAPGLLVTSVDEGEALWVNFTAPPQDDVAGYVIALSLNGTTSSIARGMEVEVGSVIAPGITVVERLWSGVPEVKRIDGLTNGRAYTVLVYAHDSTLDGRALNYSTPESGLGVPLDSKAPGPILNLALVSGLAAGTAELSFTAPGEDDQTGIPMTYEVHTSTSLAMLNDPSTFEDLPPVPAPLVEAPGERVDRTYTFAELRQSGQVPFYIGVRAIDPWDNEGPIGVAQFTINATMAPAILDLTPPIVIAGNELTIRGRYLGAGGLVTLATDTGTIALDIVRYTDTDVAVTVPLTAPSGVITLRRLPDGAEVTAYVVVISKQVDAFDDEAGAFELISVESLPGVQNAALYRERDIGTPYEAAISRVYAETVDDTPLAPFVQPDRSTAIAGAYDPVTERFVFVASNSATSMTYASITTATLAPDAERVPVIAAAGGADRVSLAVLRGGLLNEIPALIAFSLNGVIRTATTADLRTQPFPLFWVTSSTVAGVEYDRVTVRVAPTGEAVMAYRQIADGVATLRVRINPDPYSFREFTELQVANPPRVGAHFELIGVPDGQGGEEIVVVYEEIEPFSGATEVRLMRASDYGQSRGYAPFDIDPSGRRLEDVGLVVRQNEVWIALLSGRGSSVQYTELPLAAVDLGEAQRGRYRGVILDSAGGATVGRIGCKVIAAQECPIAWIGTNVQVLFTRR